MKSGDDHECFRCDFFWRSQNEIQIFEIVKITAVYVIKPQ